MSADCVMLNTHCARLDPPHLQPVPTPYRGSGYEMYPIEAVVCFQAYTILRLHLMLFLAEDRIFLYHCNLAIQAF